MRIARPFKRLLQILRQRPDREHELTINRLCLSVGAYLYLLIQAHLGSEEAERILSVTTAYFTGYHLAAVALFVHLLVWPERSNARRIIGICIDFPMVSYLIHVGGSLTAPAYPLYLWAILGNGFRFGVRFLTIAVAVAVPSFAVVIATTPFWQENLPLAGGLLAALVVLPAYVSRLIRRLSEAKRQAEEASRAKSLFLASVSHELRTPLNAIIGLSALLQEQGLEREPAEMVRTIGSAGRSLLRLINSILDLSRAEAGLRASSLSVFDLYRLLADVCALLGPQARDKRLRLAFHITARTPQFVFGDHHLLEEVLVNLVGNAVKFTDTGSVVIAVDAVEEEEAGLRFRFEVTDTGIGIAPEAQSRIFEQFTQADETILDRFGGTGLGLAICKQLVSLQGGEIGVESSPGHGSTFWFELALKRQAGAEPAREPPQTVVVLSTDADLIAEVQRVVPAARAAATIAQARTALVGWLEEGLHELVVLVDDRAVSPDRATTSADELSDGLGRAPVVIRVAAAAGSLPMARESRGRYASVLEWPDSGEQVEAALAIAAAALGPTGAVTPSEPVAPAARRTCSVLVAEDNRTNQMVIAKILQRAGHRVTLVENGEAALEALDDGQFDVVLMDVNMPLMDGLAAAERLRRLAPASRVVLYTAEYDDESWTRAETLGLPIVLKRDFEEALAAAVAAAGRSAEPTRAP